MLKDPVTVLYDSFDSKIGSPQDLQRLVENSEGIEIDKAVDIPQAVVEPEVAVARTAPSTANASKVKSEEPALVVPTPKPKESLPESLFASSYMPI